jgi:hypothetical protein
MSWLEVRRDLNEPQGQDQVLVLFLWNIGQISHLHVICFHICENRGLIFILRKSWCGPKTIWISKVMFIFPTKKQP